MKKSLSIILLGLTVAVLAHVGSVSWKTTSKDLGKVKVNELTELSFEFTNSGTNSIQILEAKGSCGCTVVDYSKESIEPGASATITATFKSSKVGMFNKSIKVKTTASDEYEVLRFSGEVVD